MLDNIKDSIKAKLYDFAYTPFMSSFLISWIILNHKYLLIYFGDEKVADKIQLLNDHVFEKVPYQGYDWWVDQFWYPFAIALGYVFVYPLFALGFYAATLWYKKWSKDVKIYIEKLTKIPEEEAKKIREISSRFDDEKDELLKKLEKKEDEYKEKLENELQPLQDQIESYASSQKVSDELIQKLEAEKEKMTRQHDAAIDTYNTTINSLEQQLSQAKGFLASKNDEYTELERKVVDLEKQLASVAPQELPFTVVNDHAERYKILEYLHGPYDTTYEGNILNTMYQEHNIPKAVTRNILNELISQEILSRSSTNQIQITPDGGLKLVEMMRGIKA